MAEKQSIERLDIRVGTIVSAEVHPNADTMYVEQINVGEMENRTIVSGLRNHISLDNFVGKKVLVLCNLKPRKLRGIESNGMILCASNEDHSVVELLIPKNPQDVKNGDRLNFEGYDMGEPDAQLNPKKKYWEDCEKDFRGNENGDVCYKGLVASVGEITEELNTVSSSSLKNYYVG